MLRVCDWHAHEVDGDDADAALDAAHEAVAEADLLSGYGMLLNANNGQIKRNVIRVARRTI